MQAGPATSTQASLTRYTPFVDGLRAVSILSVVTYHAGLPFVSGGFVGVDVFFVISGYLIINQIVASLGTGNFSFADFWARRALRILPPYLLVIVASVCIAPFVLLTPQEFHDFGREVTWSSIMLSNHYYLAVQGYFDTAAEVKPLLHLWSLAVEEQFYLLAPIVLSLLWSRRRLGRALLIWIVAALFVVSLVLCIVFTGTDGSRNAAFYIMPLRAWEFMVGGAVAFLLPHAARLPRAALEALGLAGIAAILAAVLLFSDETLFPSSWAAVPALGAGAVILAGAAQPRIIAARALALPPMVWIGLVSYAWYLWHWPLLAFGRIYNFGERVPVTDAAMVLVGLALAVLTHFAIERPIRAWRRERRGTLTWKPALIGAIACVPMALCGWVYADIVSDRVELATPAGMVAPRQKNAGKCRLDQIESSDPCIKRIGGRRAGVLIGDSHAGTMYDEIAAKTRRKGGFLTSITISDCAPFHDTRSVTSSGSEPTTSYAACKKRRDNAFRILAEGKIKPQFAIIYARWNILTPWEGKPAGNGARRRIAEAGTTGLPSLREWKKAFVAGLHRTVREFRKAGVKRVLVVGPTPELYRSEPECLMRSDKYGIPRDENCGMKRKDVEARRRFAIAWLKDATRGLRNVVFVDPLDAFCDKRYCRTYDGDIALYRDDDHLTRAGIAKLRKAYRKEIGWVLAGPARAENRP